MELDLKITIPEDFNMLCEIFGINPQFIIQLIVDQISFPRFYTHSHDKGKWATLILLDYLDNEHHMDEKEREFNEYYLEKFSNAVEAIDGNSSVEREEAARDIIREWYKAVSRNRANQILDNLAGDD